MRVIAGTGAHSIPGSGIGRRKTCVVAKWREGSGKMVNQWWVVTLTRLWRVARTIRRSTHGAQ